MSELRRAQDDLWAASEALAAYRRGDKIEDGLDAGEPTIEAVVGQLLDAQTARATVQIAAALKGLTGG